MVYGGLIFTVLTLVVYPPLFLVLLFAFFLMYLVIHFSLKTSVDALRYDAITRSPINSYYTASL